MRSKTVVKSVLITTLVLFVILVVHILWVTRPTKTNVPNVAMARIDFQAPLNNIQGKAITAWLYAQKGVTHVLCNTSSKIAVFTFYSSQVNATQLAKQLSGYMQIPATRYLPAKEEIDNGCPIVSISTQQKIEQLAHWFFHSVNN
jgi:hypothetical protein